MCAVISGRRWLVGATLLWAAWFGTVGVDAVADAPVQSSVTRGQVLFEPVEDPRTIPAPYRLDRHKFTYELRPLRRLEASRVTVYELRYPSPVVSPYPENNTVYAEYYRPDGLGPFPAVIVLDILGGDQTLSRVQSTILAQRGIAALFMQMAYYGPRRPAQGRVRLLMPNIEHSVQAVRQTVLDVRRAAAWLATQPEVDKDRLGLMGTSLGSIIGSLAAEMEPRVRRVAILLGGGGIVETLYDDPRSRPFMQLLDVLGVERDSVVQKIRTVDPLTYADRLRDRKVLMLAGKRDDIVPPKATERLWEGAGRPEIVWFDCTHHGAVLYFLPAMLKIVAFFSAPQ